MTRRKVPPTINALSAIMFLTVLALLLLITGRSNKAEK